MFIKLFIKIVSSFGTALFTAARRVVGNVDLESRDLSKVERKRPKRMITLGHVSSRGSDSRHHAPSSRKSSNL